MPVTNRVTWCLRKTLFFGLGQGLHFFALFESSYFYANTLMFRLGDSNLGCLGSALKKRPTKTTRLFSHHINPEVIITKA